MRVTRSLLVGMLVACAGASVVSAQAPRANAPDLRLVEAVKSRDQAGIESAFKSRVDPNATQPDGSTALHWAAYWDDPALVDRLLRAGAKTNARNDLGVTPLILACGNGSGPVVERLLAAGADANSASESGETVLMLAARSGNAAAVQALLAKGADVNAREKTRQQTALMWAVSNKHPEVTRLLVAKGADVNARSANRTRVFNMGGNRSAGSASADTPLEEVNIGGSTPLLFAARSGDVESARQLIAAGANVNDVQADGNTVLILAAHSGHGTLAQLLMEHGADVKAAPLGYTVLHAAVLRGTLRDRSLVNPDPGAGVALVKAVLARGADVNARVTKGTPVRRWSHDFAFLDRWVGATPYWLATRFLEIDMMRTLAAAGADTKQASRDGATPLMVAAGMGYSRASGTEAFTKDRRDFSYYNSEPFEVATTIPADEEKLAVQAVDLAIAAGNDVNATNAAGDTAVHAAASLGMNSVIQRLAEKGAKLDIRNKAGRTPADVAKRDNGIGSTVVRASTVELLSKLSSQ